ncbi:MAG: aldo/keto reductase, partial [Clostridia bacterium]|nr:aldo/keto reductase [Clostridia bacterium]
MLYNDFQDIKLSALGFGTMRLPWLADGSGKLDQELIEKMIDYAMANGVNYYDTAYPYLNGLSELSVGKALSRYPRESYYLADKYPGHQNVKGAAMLDPKAVFEDQLEKCGVEYFDFYLMHNINENSLRFYCGEDTSYFDYFLEQKKNGRIKHLGFSCHADLAGMKQYMDMFGEHMEFCQIQLNYLDWSLQKAKEKVEYLNSINMPIWVMEPVRGGKLAKLDEPTEAKM